MRVTYEPLELLGQLTPIGQHQRCLEASRMRICTGYSWVRNKGNVDANLDVKDLGCALTTSSNVDFISVPLSSRPAGMHTLAHFGRISRPG